MTPPRFAIGDPVRVSNRPPEGHMRTPRYARGQEGLIERYCGAFPNPEGLARGGDGLPKQDLYRVRFWQSAFWAGYRGAGADTLDIEVYDHWLESVHVPAGVRDAP